MVEENHLQNLKRNKTAPRMKALLSALLIVLSGVTAVVAQQTSSTNLEDLTYYSSENKRESQDEKTMKEKESQEPISWPSWQKNSTEPTKNVRDTLRPIIVLVIVESQEPISWPEWQHPSADKMEKQAEAIIAESYTDSGRVTYLLIVINSVWTNGSASTIAESVCKGKYVPDGRNDGKVTFIDLGSESYTDSGRVTYILFSLGGQEKHSRESNSHEQGTSSSNSGGVDGDDFGEMPERDCRYDRQRGNESPNCQSTADGVSTWDIILSWVSGLIPGVNEIGAAGTAAQGVVNVCTYFDERLKAFAKQTGDDSYLDGSNDDSSDDSSSCSGDGSSGSSDDGGSSSSNVSDDSVDTEEVDRNSEDSGMDALGRLSMIEAEYTFMAIIGIVSLLGALLIVSGLRRFL